MTTSQNVHATLRGAPVALIGAGAGVTALAVAEAYGLPVALRTPMLDVTAPLTALLIWIGASVALTGRRPAARLAEAAGLAGLVLLARAGMAGDGAPALAAALLLAGISMIVLIAPFLWSGSALAIVAASAWALGLGEAPGCAWHIEALASVVTTAGAGAVFFLFPRPAQGGSVW